MLNSTRAWLGLCQDKEQLEWSKLYVAHIPESCQNTVYTNLWHRDGARRPLRRCVQQLWTQEHKIQCDEWRIEPYGVVSVSSSKSYNRGAKCQCLLIRYTNTQTPSKFCHASLEPTC